MNIEKIRQDFPILQKGIIYFDNACMSLRPNQVINKITEYYKEYPACGGRSIHKLGSKVDREVLEARNSIKKLIGAKDNKQIVFTKNATEAINLVANSFKFENVLTTDREHNSNLIPWQKKNHEVLKSKEDFTFDLEAFQEKVKDFDLISFVHTSNLDGYTLPIKEIIKIVHENNAKVLIDAAQSVPHKEIDVKKLDADFVAFSGHKMLGPTGTGVLYAKEELLKEMKPFIKGGETVQDSTYEDHILEESPAKFEAGLQHYAGIIGLGEAARYLMKIGQDNIEEHEIKLKKAVNKEGLKEIGYKGDTGILNFQIPNLDAHEVASILSSSKNIMLRSGMHCVHSWYNANKLDSSARASFYFYNTQEEIETLNEELKKLIQLAK